ncbi:MAG: plasmid stabilization protein [Pseudomonadota bacterium]
MTDLVIPDLDEALTEGLKSRAQRNGRTVQEEVREIIRDAVFEEPLPENLGRAIHERFKAIGGVDLEIPPRGSQRDGPHFD